MKFYYAVFQKQLKEQLYGIRVCYKDEDEFKRYNHKKPVWHGDDFEIALLIEHMFNKYKSSPKQEDRAKFN